METLTREALIERLRLALLRRRLEPDAVCDVAAEHGHFCPGFAHWMVHTLRRRHGPFELERPPPSNEEIAALLLEWKELRLSGFALATYCRASAPSGNQPVCRGWDEWSSGQLARFYHELSGEAVQVEIDEDEVA